MSEPLEKLDLSNENMVYQLNQDKQLWIAKRLNAAIDRINELEARYEKHEHEIEADGESINVNTVGHVER